MGPWPKYFLDEALPHIIAPSSPANEMVGKLRIWAKCSASGPDWFCDRDHRYPFGTRPSGNQCETGPISMFRMCNGSCSKRVFTRSHSKRIPMVIATKLILTWCRTLFQINWIHFEQRNWTNPNKLFSRIFITQDVPILQAKFRRDILTRWRS